MQLTVESISKNEVLRYLNVQPGTVIPEAMNATIDRCIEETLRVIRPVGIFHPYRFERVETGLRLIESGLVLPGETIGKFLSEAKNTVYIMAVTVGSGMDRLIRTKMVSAPEEGVIIDTCGAAAVEAAADALESEIRAVVRAEGKYLTGRYSPGYGDLPLELQPDILRLLDTGRRIGLMVTGSVLMTPSKSVTALMGVTNETSKAAYNQCDDCKLRFNCGLRKAGKTCWKTRSESAS